MNRSHRLRKRTGSERSATVHVSCRACWVTKAIVGVSVQPAAHDRDTFIPGRCGRPARNIFRSLMVCIDDVQWASHESAGDAGFVWNRNIRQIKRRRTMTMTRFVTAWALSSAAVAALSSAAPALAAHSIDPVVQWNRNLLAIVRTPGAQPATIHPTRSFAMLHAAIYDAVNAIDQTHTPYAVRLDGVSRQASQSAAADAAAHDVLVTLYPGFTNALDAELQQSLALVPDGADKAAGIRIGQAVGDAILVLRNHDGANESPTSYAFGTAPGDYQSTPPNLPKQPQFTHWPKVTPFALTQANQFRPGAPPALTSDRYSDDVNEV